ncbi:DUF3854 domain-containing protein [Trichocoleus sp. FACHB-90]|uniref:plasmid replication protein, CyRepA1 family n=1 Tax=Cyanophyceae TaxID=3028117 RepID=UPI001685E005|nr:plasmid replication protein, CyRepA1 family [Trichocoleus sp. FACHB-90]MBD1925258.1 DUF3854 domain-containing protein [Trichocoleus sp. FACHB-90]
MIDQKHLEEWQGSGVKDSIIELNVRSFSGSAPHEQLFYSPKIERTNTGRVPNWMLNQYAHVEKGGWWCSGRDPLDKLQLMQWGCFKSNSPRRNADKKPIKYEHPIKVATRAFFLRIDFKTSLRIARRYGLEREYWERFLPTHRTNEAQNQTGEAQSKTEQARGKGFRISRKVIKCGHRNGTAILPRTGRMAPRTHQKKLKRLEDKSFWGWVLENKIPVCISEGAKKAAALLSVGFAAIALPGITSGYRRLQDEGWNPGDSRKLIPELEILKNHPVYFVFDHDQKRKTIRSVNNAIEKTGQLLVKLGCEVRVITWTQPEKGVDDFIVANGIEAFEKCYESAQSLDEWRSRLYSQLTHPPSLRLNQQYLGELSIPSDAKLVGIKSPKGSGKTESLVKLAAEALHRGEWVLILTHRVQLGMELSRKFGIPYVSEIRDCETGRLLGFGLCIDSLHLKSQARFTAENWHDGTVILDEAEQVVWHMLNSSTCQSDRVAILKEFKTLITNALKSDTGRVILSDADLSDLTLDYIQSLAGVSVNPWIVVNEWEPAVGWKVHNYQDTTPAAMIAALEEDMKRGGKPFICCSGQKAKSRFGTRNLEAHFSKKFPHLKGLRIDSESVADPNHPAFGCTSHLNELLPQYDYVLASPSIETGVSIDIKGHFTGVWAILQGVSPENSARQALARVREPVERHIWAAPHGLGKIGNGATSIKSLLASQHKLIKANLQALKTADFDCDDLDTAFDAVSLRAWAKMAVRVNAGMIDYRGSILAGLKAEGHQIITVDGGDGNEISEELTEVRDAEHQKEADAIANAPVICQADFEKLKEKRSKTQQERYQERKHSLKLRYGTNVTPNLVIKDDDGWHPKLTMHYYLTMGKQHLPARDKKRVATIREQGEGAAWLPDLNKAVIGASIAGLERLGVLRLLDTEREFKGSDADLQEMSQNAIAARWQIRAALGITINEKDSPIAIAQKLLGKLGLRLNLLRKEGARGQQQRVYGFSDPADGRDQVFAAWLARDEAARQAERQNVSTSDTVVTPGNKEYLDKPDDQTTPQLINEGSASPPPALTPEEVEECANYLMIADSPEVVVAVFRMFRDFCQQAKQAIWALIPKKKRAELREMAAMG